MQTLADFQFHILGDLAFWNIDNHAVLKLAVSIGGGHSGDLLIAGYHADHCIIKAFDKLAGTDGKFERLFALGGIEYIAVFEFAGVVHGYGITVFDCFRH